jgi:hypothetical protein
MRTAIVDELRDRSFSSKSRDPLCERAADEIERLLVVIDSYVLSSKAASEELQQLREQLKEGR